MTFLAPEFFLASLVVAAAVAALHFIVTRQPRAGILPTARFVPDLPANATARATRPSDLLLMLLRVLLVLAVGAGLAKPIVKPSRGAEARVILMDVSRSVTDSISLRDSVRALYRNHDALIVFDSSARLVSANATDSIGRIPFAGARGNLSAALIGAMRAASTLRERADSIELVVVSPFAAEEIDAATDSVRSLWKGRAKLVTVRGAANDTASGSERIRIQAGASDPLTISVAQTSINGGVIVRGSPSDSIIATDGAKIEWPIVHRPTGAVARIKRDTIGGVIAGEALVISAFERRWTYPADSLRGAEVVARWIDGEPAAIERQASTGCTRSVAVPVPAVGDLVINRDFIRFVETIAGECAARAAMRPADPSIIASLAGPPSLASRDAFRPRGDIRSGLAPWLLALALAAAITELFVRRRRVANSISMRSPSSEPEKRAA
jgi:hypothetical protein